jgi:hypothetical protein
MGEKPHLWTATDAPFIAPWNTSSSKKVLEVNTCPQSRSRDIRAAAENCRTPGVLTESPPGCGSFIILKVAGSCATTGTWTESACQHVSQQLQPWARPAGIAHTHCMPCPAATQAEPSPPTGPQQCGNSSTAIEHASAHPWLTHLNHMLFLPQDPAMCTVHTLPETCLTSTAWRKAR